MPQTNTMSYRWLVIALFWFAYFLNQADRQVLFSVFPLIQTEFGLDNTRLGLMGSVFFWVYAVMVPIAGSLGDVLSRKKIIVFALLVWSASTFGSGLVSGFALLLAMRAITGFGEAFYYPSATSIITDYHDQRTRATAMSVHQTAVYIGIIASGVIAGWIGQRYGWRPAFLTFGGVGVVFAFVLFAWLREPERGQADAVTASSLSLLERIIESFRRPSAIALALAFLGMNFVNAAFQTWTPTWLYQRFGFTLAEAGFHATFYHYVGAFLGVLLGGKVADAYAERSRLSRPLIQAIGLLCGAPVIWLLYRSDVQWFVFVALGLFGFFRGLYDSNLFASLYEVVRPEARATATGLMLCVAFLGGGSSSVIVGWLSQRAGLGQALSLTSLAYVLAGAVILLACRASFLRDVEWMWQTMAKARQAVVIVALGCLLLTSAQAQPGKAENAFVRVSQTDPRYFELSNGEPYIPVGMNLAFLRFITDEREGLAKYDEYFRKLAAQGGNYARIWLSHPFFQVERQQAGRYDETQARRIDALIASARRHGIRLKFCFEHFRTLDELPVKFPGSVSFGNPLYHLSRGGPLNNINEFFSVPAGRKLYLDKLDFYAARYRDEPAVFGWELWNEIDAVEKKVQTSVWMDWTAAMLPELKQRFPNHLVMQSLGGYDQAFKRELHRWMSQLPGNEIAQAHRYLDLGAQLEICKGPMDLLAADAVRDLLGFKPGRPVLLSEVGAVEPRHVGPSKLYEADKEGVLLHDGLFAPFFAGAAGPGQFWHWHEYVDKHDLWWHFGRFAESIRGIDPRAENFQPAQLAHPRLRIYALQGKRNWIAWCRDIQSDWKTELVAGQVPALLQRVELALPREIRQGATVKIYDPWKGQRMTRKAVKGKITLPDFKRSLVIKIEK